MKNVYDFNDFLNEGLFGSNKYKIYIDKIYNYILNMDINLIRKKRDDFLLIIRKSNNDEDPYNEDNWGEDVLIRFGKKFNAFNITRNYDYFIYINDDLLDVSNSDAKKLYKLIEQKIKDKEGNEKKKRINKSLEDI